MKARRSKHRRRLGYKFSNELRTDGEIREPVSAYSAVGLLGAHFKKTAPVELIRSGRLQADTETRPAFLPYMDASDCARVYWYCS
ncbi:hypothetical protein, partial [uncultured Limnobacter sp.]|uniref:hypothetical protein n=1 Tax=uncultured Limnobacter sp. TaxID=199681 RepID=UPI0025CF5161